jgi:hypothetical protein
MDKPMVPDSGQRNLESKFGVVLGSIVAPWLGAFRPETAAGKRRRGGAHALDLARFRVPVG